MFHLNMFTIHITTVTNAALLTESCLQARLEVQIHAFLLSSDI